MTRSAFPSWLNSPLGSALLAAETPVVADSLSNVFGFSLLQVGCWGHPDQFIQHARTRHAAVVGTVGGSGVGGICRPSRLGIASDSVDAVLLPHTLELDPNPHEVLREAERVLVGEGHLVMVGFNPLSLWGLRRVVSRRRFPRRVAQLIPERRLCDWLPLLGFEVSSSQYCALTPPVNREAVQRRFEGIDQRLARPLRSFAGVYVVVARKRVYSAPPLRVQRKLKPRVATGLAEPTVRTAA